MYLYILYESQNDHTLFSHTALTGSFLQPTESFGTSMRTESL